MVLPKPAHSLHLEQQIWPREPNPSSHDQADDDDDAERSFQIYVVCWSRCILRPSCLSEGIQPTATFRWQLLFSMRYAERSATIARWFFRTLITIPHNSARFHRFVNNCEQHLWKLLDKKPHVKDLITPSLEPYQHRKPKRFEHSYLEVESTLANVAEGCDDHIHSSLATV
jgi:hypothetical protein